MPKNFLEGKNSPAVVLFEMAPAEDTAVLLFTTVGKVCTHDFPCTDDVVAVHGSFVRLELNMCGICKHDATQQVV